MSNSVAFREHKATYISWSAMRARCLRKSHQQYQYYGARGIRICGRWNSFDNFLLDMGERPDGMTLGRIDNDADYRPSNCRWETPKQQARNRCDTRMVDGVSLAEFCETTGTPRATAKYRMKVGKHPGTAA